jgi:hypothetical protein
MFPFPHCSPLSSQWLLVFTVALSLHNGSLTSQLTLFTQWLTLYSGSLSSQWLLLFTITLSPHMAFTLHHDPLSSPWPPSLSYGQLFSQCPPLQQCLSFFPMSPSLHNYPISQWPILRMFLFPHNGSLSSQSLPVFTIPPSLHNGPLSSQWPPLFTVSLCHHNVHTIHNGLLSSPWSPSASWYPLHTMASSLHKVTLPSKWNTFLTMVPSPHHGTISSLRHKFLTMPPFLSVDPSLHNGTLPSQWP